MLKSHTYVGCNVSEIQNQKDEHQQFQDTAKVSAERSAFEARSIQFASSFFPEHIQLRHSTAKCRFCASSVVQAQLRLESRHDRLPEEDVEESACRQSRADDAIACVGRVLPKRRWALCETGAAQGVGCEAQRRRRWGKEDFQAEKVLGGARATAGGGRPDDAVGSAAANETQGAICAQQWSGKVSENRANDFIMTRKLFPLEAIWVEDNFRSSRETTSGHKLRLVRPLFNNRLIHNLCRLFCEQKRKMKRRARWRLLLTVDSLWDEKSQQRL